MVSDGRVTIRPGVVTSGLPNDLEDMYALDVACFAEPFRFSQANLVRYAQQRGALTFVAEKPDQLAGLAGFLIVQLSARTQSSYVVTLDVDPGVRRAGIADLLMQTAEHASARLGVGRMHLHVHTGNAGAVSFYERRGYVQQSLERDLYGKGLDAWVYAKPLRVVQVPQAR